MTLENNHIIFWGGGGHIYLHLLAKLDWIIDWLFCVLFTQSRKINKENT
jgi:hypothetical protein